MKRWKTPSPNLVLQNAIQFVNVLESGKGDSVKEIAEFWGNASIEEIHDRVLEMESQAGNKEVMRLIIRKPKCPTPNLQNAPPI